MKHTDKPWRVEAVSDAVRIVCGIGRQKWILARCATKQLSEGEVHANARVMAAAPDLLAVLKSTLLTLDFAIQKGVLECHGVREAALSAIAKAEGEHS